MFPIYVVNDIDAFDNQYYVDFQVRSGGDVRWESKPFKSRSEALKYQKYLKELQQQFLDR